MAIAYTKLIDNARKATAITFAVCGAGLVICANARYIVAANVFAVCVLACLVATLGLALEYLLRCWLLRPGRGLAFYQFSVGGMLIATAGVALLLALGKTFGAAVFVILVIGLVLAASFWELSRASPRPKSEEQPPPASLRDLGGSDFVPRVTRQDVLRAVQRDFPANDIDAVLRVLDCYGVETWHREKDRVHLAILKVSSGDMRKLSQLVEDARYDFRHVICTAEYPQSWAMGSAGVTELSPEEKAKRIADDRQQYEQWLYRP